jgi:hypothetical protein
MVGMLRVSTTCGDVECVFTRRSSVRVHEHKFSLLRGSRECVVHVHKLSLLRGSRECVVHAHKLSLDNVSEGAHARPT